MDSEAENDGGVAVADAPAPVVEVTPEPVAAESAPAPAPAPKPRVADPLINTITGLRSKNRENETRIERLERENAEYRAITERLAKGDKVDPAPTPQPPRPPAPDDAEIDRRAEYKLFVRDVEGVRGRGYQQYGQQRFEDAIRALGAVGADNNEFVQQVMEVDPDNAHALLHDIAQDLSVANELVNMTPGKRVAKLTRMAMAASAKTDPVPAPEPAPKAAAASKVSKAPAPAPAITPSAAKTVDWRSDDASMEEFSRGWEDNMKARHAGR